MVPYKIFKNIKTDHLYLLKHYLKDMLLISAYLVMLVKLSITPISIDLSAGLIVTIIAIINGMVTASLLHNCAHNNIPGNLLNRIVGEYCGYWVLYGFSNFTLVHTLHHCYSDQELDPVNPKGMSFLVFLSAPMRYMIRTTKVFLRMKHGHHKNYEKILTLQTIIFNINLALRITVWYILLGPSLFVFFFIPSFITIVTVFAHINYVCHQQEGEEVIVLNLDHNLYYKVANFFTMGGYYHKNHHTNLKLFNPKYGVKTLKACPLQASSSLRPLLLGDQN